MNSVLKYILIALLIIIFMCLSVSCTRAKTFKGRVIDADTKEPIEGAVVVAAWYKESWIPLGENIVKLKDVKETLTDKNGRWSIRGPSGGNSLSYGLAIGGLFYHTREPEFIIFMPGYCSWPNGFSIDACTNQMHITGYKEKIIGEGGTLELPKLTKREDRIRAQALQEPAAEGVDEKLRELHKLLNQERRNLGLGEIHY